MAVNDIDTFVWKHTRDFMRILQNNTGGRFTDNLTPSDVQILQDYVNLPFDSQVIALELGFRLRQNPNAQLAQTNLGCWSDNATNRTLPNRIDGQFTVQECREAVNNIDPLIPFYGLQYREGSPDGTKAQCWYGYGSDSPVLDPTTTVHKSAFNNRFLNLPTNSVANNCQNGLGGAWSNVIYRNTPVSPFIVLDSKGRVRSKVDFDQMVRVNYEYPDNNPSAYTMQSVDLHSNERRAIERFKEMATDLSSGIREALRPLLVTPTPVPVPVTPTPEPTTSTSQPTFVWKHVREFLRIMIENPGGRRVDDFVGDKLTRSDAEILQEYLNLPLDSQVIALDIASRLGREDCVFPTDVACIRGNMGCWSDNATNRTLPNLLDGQFTVQECREAVNTIDPLIPFYGLQYREGSPDGTKAQCWYGYGADSPVLDPTTTVYEYNGRFLNLPTNSRAESCQNGLGGVLSNVIYRNTSVSPFIVLDGEGRVRSKVDFDQMVRVNYEYPDNDTRAYKQGVALTSNEIRAIEMYKQIATKLSNRIRPVVEALLPVTPPPAPVPVPTTPAPEPVPTPEPVPVPATPTPETAPTSVPGTAPTSVSGTAPTSGSSQSSDVEKGLTDITSSGKSFPMWAIILIVVVILVLLLGGWFLYIRFKK